MDTLNDKDMIIYFNCKDGLKTLVSSLDYNQEALVII